MVKMYKIAIFDVSAKIPSVVLSTNIQHFSVAIAVTAAIVKHIQWYEADILENDRIIATVRCKDDKLNFQCFYRDEDD